MELTDMRVSELRQVVVTFKRQSPGDHPRQALYHMHYSQVARFVEATVRLHHTPGINPHTQGKTDRLWRIEVCDFTLTGPFWWTTPDLQNNHDPAGAQLIDIQNSQVAFVDPEFQRTEEEALRAIHYG